MPCPDAANATPICRRRHAQPPLARAWHHLAQDQPLAPRDLAPRPALLLLMDADEEA
jgi:hypothetical protein